MTHWTQTQFDQHLRRTGMIAGERVHIDTSDPPFAVPPDIILDVPVPPSVNKTRKHDVANGKKHDAWRVAADKMLLATGQYRAAVPLKVTGPYELRMILCDRKCAADPDNVLKAAQDYLKRIELIVDDSPKYARRIVIEWGNAPRGCRLILRPWSAT